MVGNQTFTTGSGKNRRTHRWGFATVRLGTSLPHLVLGATSNHALTVSNLPVSLDPAQLVLGLVFAGTGLFSILDDAFGLLP